MMGSDMVLWLHKSPGNWVDGWNLKNFQRKHDNFYTTVIQ